MILKEVVLHNFGSYRGRVAIDLSPRNTTGQKPIVLIGALNGSGKTTLLDAILLALYGGRARCSTRNSLSYPDFLRECINSRTPPAEGAEVSVAFDYVSTHMRAELRVTRRWRLAGQKVAEVCEVHRNGQVDVELSETWSETVENLIPLGISNLFFFDGEQVRAIASSAEPTEEVKGAIRTLLGIDLPDQLRQDLEVISSRRRRSLVKEPQTRDGLDRMADRLREAIASRASLASRLGVLQNELAACERELARLREEFTASGGAAAGRRGDVEGELQAVRRQTDSSRERLREIAAGTLPIALILPLIVAALGKASDEVASTDSAAVSRLLTRRDEEIVLAFNKAGAPRDAVLTLQTLLKADRTKRSAAGTSANTMRASSDDLAIVRRVVAETRESAAAAARATLREVEENERRARKLEAQLSVSAPDEALNRGLSGLAAAQTKISQVNAEIESVRVLHSEAQRLAAQLETEFARRSAEVDVDAALFNEDARVIRAADRVSVVMQEFRKRLLLRRVHELERHIGERFAHLHRKKGMVNRVMIDPTTFKLSLFDDDGTLVNRERMSAGEQQLLAVAFLWGLSLASGRTLPVVIDTPLGRMDHTHRRNLVERYFPRASHQVILLSTDAEVDQTYQGVLNELGAVDREYLLSFDPAKRETRVADGYFWSA